MASNKAFAAAVFAAALPAVAFLPPVDSRDGVTARFVGLDEQRPSGSALKPNDPRGVVCAQRDGAAPFEVRLDLANTTDAPVSGELRIWLNDDWDLALPGIGRLTAGHHEQLRAGQHEGQTAGQHERLRAGHHEGLTAGQSQVCILPAHSTNSVFATAIPKPGRVIPALYPVHATFAFSGGEPLHPIAVFEVQPPGAAAPGTEQTPGAAAPGTEQSADMAAPGAEQSSAHDGRLSAGQPLALLPGASFAQMPGDAPRPVAEAAETGAFINMGWHSADGDLRFGFFSQPPWRTGGGYCWRDIPVSLPAAAPLSLCLSAAIRPPLRAGEGRSDGADYKVYVVEKDGRATEIYSALVKETSWTDGTADLTPWAGQAVTIRLWNGCGPANDPNYDRCLWGDVGVCGGAGLAPGASAPGRADLPEMPLSVRGESWTARIAPGEAGLFDGTISFSDGGRTLSFSGFTCAIDDILVGTGPLDARCTGWSFEHGAPVPGDTTALPHPDAQALPCAILHRIDMRDGRTITARATLFAEGPALRIRWDMPGVERTFRGSPRFTRLGIGPASLPAERAYMSFGNVLEKPRAFELTAGLFRNMASHAGADYSNGASLVQAVDSLPDRILCRRESNVFAVETSHDATLSFVPSARGAFAAARAWREVAGFKPGAGWREAATRLCLDQWGGPKGGFAKAARALDRLAAYGVTNAIYCRHVWQRWGFDNRLPDIWPLDNKQPHGSEKVFLDLVATARRHGHLFVPHDNYIDHYPDSVGFSYDDTVFDESGAPVKAWFNYHVSAQSYRWAPNGFLPALRANAAALRDGYAPGGVFLDVFSNMAPWDWYDRNGRFHTRAETRAAWGEAFDEYRRILGEGTITIGEGGHDELIGHLDAGQPDHFTPERWMDRGEYADSERIPWLDIATHGSFVLYGGGLGWRYASNSPERSPETYTKGYCSDSYYCTTVIGGRTPFAEFDPFEMGFYIHAVEAQWLLGAVCRDLALSEFESFEFEGPIHRQRAVFAGGEGGGGQVWVNRPSNLALPGEAQNREEPRASRLRPGTWRLPNGLALPPDGFYAETVGARAGIVEIDGRRCAFSQTGDALFVDGRPDRRDGTGPADTANAAALADFAAILRPGETARPGETDARADENLALPCGIRTDGAFRLQRAADGALILTPVPDMGRPFRAEMDLAGSRIASGATAQVAVSAVEQVEPAPGAAAPTWRQDGSTLSLSVDSKAFAYRIAF